ncbi:uncharacterized protein LOC122072718 [Macadamia integrifolia]|uniref:uncharacterized protein LOC122072718 n=1 Tax=Macadamia integrifolia TaxID=60698 RepID=UPI001C4F861F|nr:uncharacterized protein LOC122072718 [Macadamia integrifolia]
MMIILSLFFQILLILLGDRRKHNTGKKIGFFIWVAYLGADSVATFALGVLSKTQQGQRHTQTDELRAFWAPFLLLHLGGPDTITAYALEDNELWLRHLLALLIQVSVAFYVIFRSWTRTPISVLTILMFFTGIIKYGERTLALRWASKEHFRKSMLSESPPDPGPNYAKFMEGYVSKQEEGFVVDVVRISEDRLKLKKGQSYSLHHQIPIGGEINASEPAENHILEKKAHHLFKTFKRLYAGLILKYWEGEESKQFIKQSTPEKAFEVVEIELGFMFDLLYTKMPLVCTREGAKLRLFCFCLTICVFVSFFTTVENPKHRPHYSNVDIFITYLLLNSAILLELYGFIILLSSDRMILWLSKHKHKHKMASMAYFLMKPLQRKKRWSNSMGQYNVISSCLKDEATTFSIMTLTRLCNDQEMLDTYWYTFSNTFLLR